MPVFRYIAKDREGNSVTGSFEASDRLDVIDLLRKKDLIIISVEEAAPGFKLPLISLFKTRIKLDDLAIFSRQLATMVDAGITLVGALDILSEQMDNKTFRAVIIAVKHDVETGSSLSEALAKHKNIFSSLYVNMVKAGESSGMLDEILDRLAEYLEKTSALERKVASAMVYPAIVSIMALGITLLLLLKVIPVFKSIFEGFGAKLPTPTLILIAISDGLRKFFAIAAVVFIALFFVIDRYLKTEKGRIIFDKILFKLPVFGLLLKKVAIGKFTRTFSTLIKSGVPILTALEIVGKASGNKVIESAINDVRVNVREGESIATPLMKAKVFPSMVTRMVSVGEQAGELEKMLSKIADFYEDQVDATVKGLTSIIEPFIIAFLGIVIGSIVICMFLPIFKITTIMGM